MGADFVRLISLLGRTCLHVANKVTLTNTPSTLFQDQDVRPDRTVRAPRNAEEHQRRSTISRVSGQMGIGRQVKDASVGRVSPAQLYAGMSHFKLA